MEIADLFDLNVFNYKTYRKAILAAIADATTSIIISNAYKLCPTLTRDIHDMPRYTML